MVDEKIRNDILVFLRKISVMSAALVGERGPISTVLLFTIDDDFTLYFASRKNSFKSKALSTNPRIGFSVWEHNVMMIQADGVAEQITEELEVEKILDSLARTTAQIDDFWPPVLRITDDDYVVYRVIPNWMRKLDLSDTTIHADDNMFLQII